MRIQLKKDLPIGKRVVKAGRTITITNDKYKELKKLGYFDEPIVAKAATVKEDKNDSQPKTN